MIQSATSFSFFRFIGAAQATDEETRGLNS